MIRLLTLLSFVTVTVTAHTWMLTPAPRYPDLCMPPGTDNSNCCREKPSIASVGTTYRRGEIIPSTWGRNNHVGGFIRYSIVPIAQSDTKFIFDKLDNVFQYNCYAPQCVGNNGDFFAGDPGGTPFNGIKCQMMVKIPDYLPDGTYTIQWRWHSGGDSRNEDALGLTDWVACHDFKIAGGPLNSKPQCPLFIGGDAADPTKNACEFLKDNKINTCTTETGCYGWYAKAPPKDIMNCPTNILPGGMSAALRREFAPGRALSLYVGASGRQEPKPGNVAAVNLASIRSQASTIATRSTTTRTTTGIRTTTTGTTTATTAPTRTSGACSTTLTATVTRTRTVRRIRYVTRTM